MALIDSAVNGLAGAMVSGGAAVALFWAGRRGRRNRLDEAWRKQARELDTRLANQYQGQISRLWDELGKCQAETRRLNKLLSRRGDRPDD